MKKGTCILTIVLLLLSCGKKVQERHTDYNDEKPVVEEIMSDSVVSSSQEETSKFEDAKTTTEKVNSSSENYDNMRGFDPASEDDMDDNGMSRFMENNDDEGWD